ncbi:uncharacterized protein LTR77_004273 [Saxophila tyrrhenica]|uniref:Uncharacterized protein n=1 Tax=Saxophila tyrrhenica TaxID=1690608 RepID=A0AAV9PET0_9PEZI|nr:hypothetical protein LTR77_004273 [Saxophila tyrrhenica]
MAPSNEAEASASANNESHAEYCFSLDLMAYDHGITERDPQQILRLGELTKDTKTSKDENLKAGHLNPFKPSVLPNADELDYSEGMPGVNSGIWIGMIPSKEAKERSEVVQVGEGKAKTRGSNVNDLVQVKLIATDANALRAIVKRGGSTAVYYALTQRDGITGLCNGTLAAIEDVFFFREFRNDSLKQAAERKMQWGALARQAAGIKDKDRAAKGTTLSSLGKVALTLQRQAATETGTLCSQYQQTGKAEYLEQLKRVLEVQDVGNNHEPLLSNISLSKLIDNLEKPSTELCEAAWKEIEVLWPPVASVLTSEKLEEIARCLFASKKSIPYHLVRHFLVICMEEIDKVDADFESLDNHDTATMLVDRTMDKIALLCGEGGSPPKEEDTNSPALVQWLEQEAKEQLAAASLFKTQLAEAQEQGGDTTGHTTFEDIWQDFGSVMDVDSAKLMGVQIWRACAARIAENFWPIEAKIREKARQWRTMAKDIEEVLSEADDETGGNGGAGGNDKEE